MKALRQYSDSITRAKTPAEILPIVQKFIELEHATIPPYLCGYFTIKQGSNKLASDIILSVVIEEMLHLTIASNLLNALGGAPAIDNPGFVPKYPGELPFGVGEDFKVHLRKCSVDQVHDVFMKIEEPEKKIDIHVLRAFAAGAADEFDVTIGLLYSQLSDKLKELEAEAQKQGKTIFVGDHDRQVVPHQWFPDRDDLFAIHTIDDAVRGIEVIVDQGEGTSTDPFDEDGNPAHYYRFEQIYKGKLLEHLPGETPSYAYSGLPVVLDMSEIYDMDENPSISDYEPGSFSQRMAVQFSYNYTKLLRALHRTFNGEPGNIDRAMGGMYELRFSALQALETPAKFAANSGKSGNKRTGLTFEYTPVNAAPSAEPA